VWRHVNFWENSFVLAQKRVKTKVGNAIEGGGQQLREKEEPSSGIKSDNRVQRDLRTVVREGREPTADTVKRFSSSSVWLQTVLGRFREGKHGFKDQWVTVDLKKLTPLFFGKKRVRRGGVGSAGSKNQTAT